MFCSSVPYDARWIAFANVGSGSMFRMINTTLPPGPHGSQTQPHVPSFTYSGSSAGVDTTSV